MLYRCRLICWRILYVYSLFIIKLSSIYSNSVFLYYKIIIICRVNTLLSNKCARTKTTLYTSTHMHITLLLYGGDNNNILFYV